MKTLDTIYPFAVEHTKKKVFEDIEHYLENKPEPVHYEHYRNERAHYLDQLWINIWINKATNAINKKEKKAFLTEKGFQVEGVDRKLINQLFRNEIRDYQPFDIVTWLDSVFYNHNDAWLEQFEQARMKHEVRLAEERIATEKMGVVTSISEKVEQLFQSQYEVLYLYIRYYVAKQIMKDFERNPKFGIKKSYQLEKIIETDELLSPSDFRLMSDLFEELTGAIHESLERGRVYYEYETYNNLYETLITQHLFEIAPGFIFQRIPNLKELYEGVFDKPLSDSALRKLISELILELSYDYTEEIAEEYVVDLVKLADVPFDEDVHLSLFKQDCKTRDQRQEAELAEMKRKEEEEARIIEEVFGSEYRPSIGGNIHFVLHIGETNTGKTHQALRRMKQADSGLYLAPLRLLALEVYDKLNAEGVPCSLKTGEEEKFTPGASHVSCTVEMFYEKEFYDCIVIDEAQMLADKDRGYSWYKAITKANAKEVHIIGSRNIKEMLLELLGESSLEIHDYSREIPLEVESREFNLSHTKKGDALVCFSRRKVLETAARLQSMKHKVSMIYGSMPPETRKKQIQRFNDGETTTIVSTDAIGMGLNLPIRRIVFLENEKFDGTRRRRLTSQEVKQIAGRAGRKGIYDIGKVAFSTEIGTMKKLLANEDEPVQSFAIAPTNAVFERFQKYYHDLGTFFELWDKFKSPKGTKKASLTEERELYQMVQGTEIEARLSLKDLYGFLHLPFSSKEVELRQQWRRTIYAILEGYELPEPNIKKRNLEELELTYKALGLHLLFLYRLEQRTEAHYWERVREEISDDVHEHLKSEIKTYKNKCKRCGRNLPLDFSFPICDSCHSSRYRREYDKF
ncbi:RNA helicase [Bacillus sp. DNRA2]|uniref:DEAD/DEAH box helicase n=1 Tax=Bacillus sp. DNRA2 TaxID=2723053 RepID=UPI00145C59BB|nr:DEAD/DEAH box helicase [Bacillus sp. DNRA2]NMD69889.1 RNA helicase [Bacillus sp. DNRA2]